MADNNIADLNLVTFHIKQKYGAANIAIENVDCKEEIIKMDTEVIGGSWAHQNMKDILKNENKDWKLQLENTVEDLNSNSGKEEKYLVNHNRVNPYQKKEVAEENSSTGMEDTKDHTQTCERINYIGSNCQKDNENEEVDEKVGLDGEENKPCHTMEKPYKCNECSYSTIRKFDLLSHIKSRHTIEKPYKCDECSYAAVLKKYLLSHIKHCHPMGKPYKCNECSYSAVQKSSLLNHIGSLHTLEKLYKCNECSYSGAQKSNLLSHIKFRHTFEKGYRCNECSYSAVKKITLSNHIKSHHTMEKAYIQQ